MPRRPCPDAEADRLALRYATIEEVFAYLRERLPAYNWTALEVRSEGWPPHVVFGGSHCAADRLVCLTIDRRVIDCAAVAPEELLLRLDLAQVETELERGDPPRAVSIELD